MDFNFDTGTIFGGLQSLDVTTLPPLGGQLGVLTIIGDGALTLPVGVQLARPASPAAGMFRFNADTTLLEYYNGTTWSPLSTSSSTVSSVAANSNSTGLTVTGSPITSAGTLQFTLDAGLEALATFASTGMLVSTGTNTWTSRTIAGTAGNIVVTDGSGVVGNPTIDLDTVTQTSGGTFSKVTLDGFGRVVQNTTVTTSDITTLVDGTYVNVSGDTMASAANLTFVGGGEVLGLPVTPSGDTAAVSKAYVDAIAAGLSWKQAVKAATTVADGNIDLATGGLAFTVDGYTPVAGNRILVKNQTDPAENGIYIASATGWTRSPDMDATTPINEINGAATYVENGTTQADTGWTQIDTVTTLGVDPIAFVQFSGAGSYTAGSGLTLSGTVFSLTTPVVPSLGGTGSTSIPTNGQLLIGNGTNYTLSTLTGGTAIGITNAAGSITINNTGVTSLAGTANEVTVSSSTGAVTLGLPGDVTIANSLTVSTLTPNAALYVGAAGLLTSSAALTDGQILVGSTGNPPTPTTITAGTGISVTNAAGSITIATAPGSQVTSFSAGTTGFTPNSATTGNITLAGTLSVANGGTGLTSLGTANQVLGVNSAGTAAEYKTISAGTGMSVVDGANVITLNNTGVTSVGLQDSSTTAIYTITNTPVTTTGTLTMTLASQTANTVFAAPNGSAGQPSFRALTLDDLGTALQLYKESATAPVTPVSSGTNSVAIGSGSSATAVGSFAEGAGTNARIFGQKAYANGSFASAGDAQHGVYVLRNVSTGTGFVELFLDGVTATERIVLPNNSLFTFEILIAGVRNDGVSSQGAGYRFIGIAKKDGVGTISFVGTPSKTIIGETVAAWDVRLTAPTAGASADSIMVEARGAASTPINWVATVLTTEVTF